MKNPIQDAISDSAPEFSVEEIKAVELWEAYFESVNKFDNLICTGKNERGISVPMDSDEMVAINKYALMRRDEILNEAARFGISAEQMKWAKNYVLRRK